MPFYVNSLGPLVTAEHAYRTIQNERPPNVGAYALVAPVGLMAWLVRGPDQKVFNSIGSRRSLASLRLRHRENLPTLDAVFLSIPKILELFLADISQARGNCTKCGKHGRAENWLMAFIGRIATSTNAVRQEVSGLQGQNRTENDSAGPLSQCEEFESDSCRLPNAALCATTDSSNRSIYRVSPDKPVEQNSAQ